jgi:hypothetical protein
MPSPFDMIKIRALAMSSTFAEAIWWIRNAWRLIEVVDNALSLAEKLQRVVASDIVEMVLSRVSGA